MTLYTYTEQLANRLQYTWEHSQRIFYRNLSISAPCEDTRAECRKILGMMRDGIWSFRRNYRVRENQSNFEIIYDNNFSGMPSIHCVVGKRHGDVARYTTELINESCFQYNLLDPRSRDACMAAADYEGKYLEY